MSTFSQVGKRPRVAIIGGGLFGVTAALILARDFEVEIFERSSALLRGATFANHGRQHLGFHYPRSPETARQCRESRQDFRSFYAAAEVDDFPNYYGIARLNSKVSPEQYLEFCRENKLQFYAESAPAGVMAEQEISLSLRAGEGVIDYAVLRNQVLEKLKETPAIEVHLSQSVVEGQIQGNGLKQLTVGRDGSTRTERFDVVVNATYAHYNTFCDWFGFKPRRFQFNLQELNVIELPRSMKLGVTIMDGPFPSFLPLGRTQYHLLAHVNASQLARESSAHTQPLLSRVSAVESNWDGVLAASAEYLPILREARYIRSLFVDRVVDADAAGTDSRLTELTDHGSGCFSIFAAKVITCVSTAKKLAALISTCG